MIRFQEFYHMRYEELKKFGEEEFRRLTGVKKNTFARMTIILEEAETGTAIE